MVRSMTAFARQEEENELGVMSWEFRSVNHRYLELNLRMPEELRAMEASVRERIGARLSRGKVDGFFRFRPAAAAGVELTVNQALVKELGRAISEVNQLVDHLDHTNALEIIRWPGVVQVTETNREAVQTKALELLDKALDDAEQSRRREGKKIVEAIAERCDAIGALVEGVKQRLPQVLELYRQKLVSRLEELKTEMDPQRLEQEMVYAAQKSDVAEELDRLGMHVTEAKSILKRSEPVGRRLDFLMQEFNREANTLASKSIDVEVTRAAVDMKVLIEQMREQIQNIE